MVSLHHENQNFRWQFLDHRAKLSMSSTIAMTSVGDLVNNRRDNELGYLLKETHKDAYSNRSVRGASISVVRERFPKSGT